MCEKHKLGDICDILNGRNQKKVEDINGKYPIYGSGGIMGYANDYICKAGTTIIGRKGSINKPLYVDTEFWNVDTAFGLQPKECCHSRFLYYLCKSIDFTRYDKGVTIPSLVKSDLLQIPVSIPSLEEQYRIVEELDLLSNIIEKKLQQLSELDNFAQSIFYDMFGDPVKNEKGWEVKKLKDVARIIGGSTPKTNVEEYWNGEYFWVTPAELKGDRYIKRTERCISEKAINHTNLTLLPIGTVLLSSRAPIGKVCITRVPMYCNQGFKNVVCSNLLNNEYVCQFLMIQKDFLHSLGTGATFKEISKKITENIDILLPPLSLQQLFAKKIEAIEEEKVLIKKSVVETEIIFLSKMYLNFK